MLLSLNSSISSLSNVYCIPCNCIIVNHLQYHYWYTNIGYLAANIGIGLWKMDTVLLGQSSQVSNAEMVKYVQGADCMRLWIQPVSEISDGYLFCIGVSYVLLEFARTTRETGVYLNRRDIQKSYSRWFAPFYFWQVFPMGDNLFQQDNNSYCA